MTNSVASIHREIKSITDRPVTIVAVTKNRTVDQINEVIKAGITNIGGNRLQEAMSKFDDLPSGITKHFIGQLQTNKVRDVVKYFDVIQSVDSLKLAQKIDTECERTSKIMPILIQVNISNEPQKGGIEPNDFQSLLKNLNNLKYLKVLGLMGIASQTDYGTVRQQFRQLKKLADRHGLKVISMGMSEDYKIAIEEGATIVRIGRLLFD